MATNNKLSSSIATTALRSYFLEQDLSFFLGNTDQSNLNTIDSNNDIPQVANVAFSITADEIKEVIHFDGDKERMFKIGSDQYYGYYHSGTPGKNVDRKEQSHFIIKTPHGEFLAIILGYYGNVKCNKEKLGSIIPRNGLTKTDGKIYLQDDGIAYTVVQQNNDGIDGNLNNSFLEVMDSKSQRDKVDKYSGTSKKSEAAGVCGAGNEMRCGTCCLYNKEAYYDVIQDKNFGVGSLYKCIESKCYECIEYARKLDKKYRFNRWLSADNLGPTGGTGEGCLGCTDNDGAPTNCGPCDCKIDINERWHYEQTLGDKNINPTSSFSRNAQLEKYNQENLDRCITSIWFNPSGLTKLQRKLSSTWTSPTTVPLIGDAAREADVSFAFETDGDGSKYLIGIEFPGYSSTGWNGGQGYSRVSLNTTTMSSMFPDLSLTDENGNSRFEINISPLGGFAGNQNKLFSTKLLLAKTINMADISDFTSFNTYGIGYLVNEDGASIMSDVDFNQPSKQIKLTTQVELTKVGGGAVEEDDVKGGGITPGNNQLDTEQTAIAFNDPVVNQVVLSSGVALSVEVASKDPTKYTTGQILSDQEDNEFNITDVVVPTSNGKSVDLNSTFNRIEFVNSINIKSTGDARNNTARLFIILGSA